MSAYRTGGVESLTARELDVLALVTEGLSNEGIARRTCLGVKSIEAVVRSLFVKLGLTEQSREENRRVLAARAYLAHLEGRRHVDRAPAANTCFVGRVAELETLTELLAQRRVVTIAGQAGIGKTRLALELARRAVSIDVRVWFADVGAAGDLRGAVAAAVGVAPNAADATQRTMRRELGGQRGLLVLDDLGVPLAAAAFALGDLVEIASLAVLATTRHTAGVAGTTVWQAPPLCPSDAVELLRIRASEAGADLSDVSVDQLRPLCERLGRSPATIEAAAARLGSSPPDCRYRR